jgi:molecular chaperone DnaK (HSP70)
MTTVELQGEQLPSRFVVGIDLGTTNSAVCYVDTHEQPWRVRVLSIPQLTAPRQIETVDTLPSFHYQPIVDEAAGGALRLPWSKDEPNYTVGVMARDYGAGTPGRMIASAKSWLCHTGVDRTADLLPWHGATDVDRLSPVEASSRYLRHIRDAWNAKFRGEPLEQQDIVLTLPASFDEVARELTVEAAAKGSLPRITLIEEPQAAFYAWIYKHTENWDRLVSPGQKILVCDIGGGTSDFTLIRVRRGDGSAAGKVQFHRVAVGEHLILGGDNFDLALAQSLEAKLSTGKLQPRQWDVLLRLSRQLKEEMLSETGPEQRTVSLPGTGSKLIGGSLQIEVTRDEVRQTLVEGFMPLVDLKDRPAARRSGFQEFGLPYAADAAITRYLAAFLTAHRSVAIEDAQLQPGDDPARPDVLLFNGGVFDSPVLRERLIESLSRWFSKPGKPAWRPLVLENDRLDLAVARGAAYYGMVRRGEGVKIAASLARTYYLGVDADPPSALCLVPGNAETGQDIVLPQHFDLVVSEPAEFPLFTSSIRLTDRPGELVSIDREQMTALPPIRTALKTRRRSERGTVPVELHAKLTEIGTLDLWCSEVGGERSWRLQFDVRSATQTDIDAHESAAEAEGVLDEVTWQAAHRVIQDTFGPQGTDSPDALVKRLIAALGSDRGEWPTSLLRRIWESLLEAEAGRRKSAVHEARWLNLLGYSLRPGYGLAVDDWRVAETWKTVQGKLAHPAATSRTESLILWRRIGGGLTAGQQRALAEPLVATVRSIHKRFASAGAKPTEGQFSPHEATEVLRLLGSLELLAGERKLELGRMLLELLPKRKLDPLRPAMAWAIGRLGQREPVYGPLNTVVSVAEATRWLAQLLALPVSETTIQFAVVQLARKTGDRYRDMDDELRSQTLLWLKSHGAGQHALQLVEHGGQLDTEEQNRVFGDVLPKGLRIR